MNETGRQHGRHGERHYERGNGERDVVDAHDKRFDPAAEIAGDEPERDADGHGYAEHRNGEDQRDAIAEQHAGEDVASDIVGAEPVAQRGRLMAKAEIDDRADMVGMR